MITKSDLETMDISYGGLPFVWVAAKPGIDLDTLDYSYGGLPFWGVEELFGAPSLVSRIFIIPREERTFTIPEEDRRFIVLAENRTYIIRKE